MIGMIRSKKLSLWISSLSSLQASMKLLSVSRGLEVSAALYSTTLVQSKEMANPAEENASKESRDDGEEAAIRNSHCLISYDFFGGPVRGIPRGRESGAENARNSRIVNMGPIQPLQTFCRLVAKEDP